MRRLLAVLVLLGLLAVHGAARAGGGESYSGSSSGSSSYSYSGGSGSTDSGDLLSIFLYMYVRFVFQYPLVGFPLTLFIFYMTRALWLELNTKVAPLSGGATPEGGQSSSRKNEELARLRARDQAFDERAFLRRAGVAFLKVQEAWSSGDMAPARAFISDGVSERFGRQLAALKARGLRNLMEGVEISDIELLACRSDAHFDALWVRIAAAASDRMIGEDGAAASGSGGRQPFEEVWTFLRRPGVKTLKRAGLIEGSCPSCGASLPLADAGQCATCKSWVNSGVYDWVLAEITQSCEWVMREPSRDVDGWAAAAAEDPALSLPVLEDRTSVIFWRWADACRQQDIAPLRAVAGEAFLRDSPAFPAPFDDAAVGAVEIVAFEDAGEWRRVHIGVKWSGGGELRRNFFVLSRARGAKTDAHQGLRTARCPSCGAPPAERSEAACAYCGALLNDGKRDWILTEIVPFGEWRRPGGVSTAGGRSQPPIAGLDWGADMSPADAFAVLARAMISDGEVTLAEKSFLEAYALSRGIPQAKAAAIAAAARAGLLDAPKASDGAQAEAMLRGMIRMSLTDGIVAESERAALYSFAARFGLRPDAVIHMIVEESEAMSRSVRGVV